MRISEVLDFSCDKVEAKDRDGGFKRWLSIKDSDDEVNDLLETCFAWDLDSSAFTIGRPPIYILTAVRMAFDKNGYRLFRSKRTAKFIYGDWQ